MSASMPGYFGPFGFPNPGIGNGNGKPSGTAIYASASCGVSPCGASRRRCPSRIWPIAQIQNVGYVVFGASHQHWCEHAFGVMHCHVTAVGQFECLCDGPPSTAERFAPR